MSYGMGPTGGNKIPSGYRYGQLQQFNPQQMKLFKQSFGDVGSNSYLSQLAGGDESLFQDIEAPAFRQFQEQTGQLASRFSGMGLGGQKSSAFRNANTQAASDFAMQLQAQRQGLQRQAMQDLWGMKQQLLGQKPYDQFLVEKQHKPSFLDKWLGLAGNTMGAAAKGFSMGGF